MKEKDYVLEYSKAQDAYHVQSFEEHVRRNRRLHEQDLGHSGYMILGVGSREECDQVYSEITKLNKEAK
jgi:hypothetical protein